jgi:hypothetical protein
VTTGERMRWLLSGGNATLLASLLLFELARLLEVLLGELVRLFVVEVILLMSSSSSSSSAALLASALTSDSSCKYVADLGFETSQALEFDFWKIKSTRL